MATPLTMRVIGLSNRLSRSFINSSNEIRCRSFFSKSSKDNSADDAKTNKGEEQLKEETVKEASESKKVDQKTEKDNSAKDEEIAAQIKKLEEDLKNTKDKYMYQLAEAQNLRTRMTNQVADAKKFGIQGFCKDLLEVSDTLGTAIAATPQDQLTNSNPHLVALYQGLNMTQGNLLKVFKKHGLVAIAPAEGDKFDPNVHEALFMVPATGEQKADTVAVVQQTGYALHERTIRSAKVGVFKS